MNRILCVTVFVFFSFPYYVVAQDRGSISTASLSEIAIYPGRSAPAEVVSLNHAVISSQLNAQVLSIPVRVGDTVAAGDRLALLDCRSYDYSYKRDSARRKSSEARFKLTQQRYQRTKQLVSQRLASEEDLDDRQSGLDAAQGDMTSTRMDQAMAKLNRDKCEVKSPSAALVTERMASEGQLASVGTALVKIVDTAKTEISAQVYLGDVDQLVASPEVTLEVNGKRIPVKLRKALETVNPSTRNREVRLDFLETSASSGSTGKILWHDSRPHLPPHLMVKRGSNYGFFVNEKGIARFVVIDNAQPGRASPIEGLSADAQIITKGHVVLEDQSPLEDNQATKETRDAAP